MRGVGRKLPHRNIPSLELPESLELPTCENCGEEWWDAETTRTVHDALETAYQQALSKRAEEAIERLVPTITQRDLEHLVGVSPGYLSKVKGGKRASAPLVATLMLLASSPRRVEELRELWEMGVPKFEVVSQVEPVVWLRQMRRPALPREPEAMNIGWPSELVAMDPLSLTA